MGFLMFQGGSTLPATYFTQRRGCLRPWSVPSDVNVAPSHLGNAVTVTLRQQETHGNTLNDMNHVATSCAITVQGHHDNASRTKTFEAECAHYNTEKGRPRRQTKQLELSKNHCDQTDLQLQRKANDWKQMEMNGNDSGLNLAPIIHPLNIASSTGDIRKPSFPSTVDAPLNTASTELHESENNAPGRHPSRDIDWHPINVMGRHEFANPRLESALNNALHKHKGEMAPGPFPSKGSVSSATQLGRPSADAASTGKLVSSLFDDLKDVWTSNVTPDSTKCAEDVKTSVANGSAAQDHPKELGQRASPLQHRTQPGDLDKCKF